MNISSGDIIVFIMLAIVFLVIFLPIYFDRKKKKEQKSK